MVATRTYFCETNKVENTTKLINTPPWHPPTTSTVPLVFGIIRLLQSKTQGRGTTDEDLGVVRALPRQAGHTRFFTTIGKTSSCQRSCTKSCSRRSTWDHVRERVRTLVTDDCLLLGSSHDIARFPAPRYTSESSPCSIKGDEQAFVCIDHWFSCRFECGCVGGHGNYKRVPPKDERRRPFLSLVASPLPIERSKTLERNDVPQNRLHRVGAHDFENTHTIGKSGTQMAPRATRIIDKPHIWRPAGCLRKPQCSWVIQCA